MPKVYITNTAGHDFTQAKKFGEIVWITRGFVSFQSLDRLKYKIIDQIKDSTPDDYLLISGTLLVSIVAAIAWYEMHQKVCILVHSRNDGDDYRKFVITKENIHDIFHVIKYDSTKTPD